jgi:hypothetical protein
MIRQGEATLRRILHPEYDRDDDDDELMRRVLVSSMARPSCSIQYQPRHVLCLSMTTLDAPFGF